MICKMMEKLGLEFCGVFDAKRLLERFPVDDESMDVEWEEAQELCEKEAGRRRGIGLGGRRR